MTSSKNMLMHLTNALLCIFSQPNKNLVESKITNDIFPANQNLLVNKENIVALTETSVPKENLELETYIAKLNQTKIFLLTTKSKLNKEILLLISPEDRFNSEEAIIKDNYNKFYYSSTTALKKTVNKFYFPRLTRSNFSPSFYKNFRNSKSYYLDNLGGYKSICPIFSDKNLAEDFLLKNSKDTIKVLKTLSLKSTKKLSKSLADTSVVSLGLGDLIEFYSSSTSEKYLKKVEFLIIPNLNKKDFSSKLKNFSDYQKQYFELKSL